MKIDYLPWDSSFFNIKIGKVEVKDSVLIEKIETDFISHNFDLIYLFSKEYLPLLSTSVLNIDLVDIMITMSCNLETINVPYTEPILINEICEDHLDEVYGIAQEISYVSRFSKEPLIGVEKTKQFYRTWIDNSLNKTYADGIFVHIENGKIAGIHSIKTDIENQVGNCSIIGVDPNIKGAGIGKKLWNDAFNYWKSLGNIKKCVVPFSLNNKPSFNFHLKMGFNVIEDIKYIYHIKKK